jgi:hypothetical protein
MEPRVLDPACGSRMFWFDKNNPDAVFGDVREESHTLCDGRSLSIHPDVILDFTSLPFEDGRFNLVVFDPPHLNNCGPKGWQGIKYGRLPKEWRGMLSKGFEECFRVLAENGTLIFKWNETRIKLSEVLSLTPVVPLFGHTTTQSIKTHWITFMKPRKSSEVII